jgi:hypothetical protein
MSYAVQNSWHRIGRILRILVYYFGQFAKFVANFLGQDLFYLNIGNCSASHRQGLKPQAKSPKPTQVGWISGHFSLLALLALSFSSGPTARLSSYE